MKPPLGIIYSPIIPHHFQIDFVITRFLKNVVINNVLDGLCSRFLTYDIRRESCGLLPGAVMGKYHASASESQYT